MKDYKSDIFKANRGVEAVQFPAVILIDNCNSCNLRCSMCDHGNIQKYRKYQTLDYAIYQKVITEISVESPNSRVWEIFFGDPFLCKDMPQRIEYAKSQGLTDVVLNSNGQLMSREKGLEYIQAGLDAIYIGIDAARKDTYEKIRVGGNFERVVNNVRAYRDSLKKYGKPTQKLFVQFVLSDINENEVEEFKTFWIQEGVNVKIRPKVSWGGLIEAKNLLPIESKHRKPCYWLMRTINICADGEVALCSVDVHCRVPCGNVKDFSIKDLWQGRLKELREMHLSGKFDCLPQMCRECNDWQSGYAEFYQGQETK